MNGMHLDDHEPAPTISSFTPSNILPREQFMGSPELPNGKLTHINSAHELDIKIDDEAMEEETFSTRPPNNRSSTTEANAYNLAPPPPSVSDSNAEVLSEYLFSVDHLNLILNNNIHFHNFRNFLNKYRPQSIPILVQYLESYKALTAIRYANLIADQIYQQSQRSSRSGAAVVDAKFEKLSRRSIEELVNDALPAYITYRLVLVVTECLVKEVTGTNTPLMREMIQGLAEVYCLADPSLPDCPIVFASEGEYILHVVYCILHN